MPASALGARPGLLDRVLSLITKVPTPDQGARLRSPNKVRHWCLVAGDPGSNAEQAPGPPWNLLGPVNQCPRACETVIRTGACGLGAPIDSGLASGGSMCAKIGTATRHGAITKLVSTTEQVTTTLHWTAKHKGQPQNNGQPSRPARHSPFQPNLCAVPHCDGDAKYRNKLNQTRLPRDPRPRPRARPLPHSGDGGCGGGGNGGGNIAGTAALELLPPKPCRQGASTRHNERIWFSTCPNPYTDKVC
jgi:hypothetical protein